VVPNLVSSRRIHGEDDDRAVTLLGWAPTEAVGHLTD
jgi:hypothetical protein